MKALFAAALSIGIGLPGAAPAQLPEAYKPKPIYDRCARLIDMRGLVNAQRLECATFDMDRADGALNAAYRTLVTHLPAARRQQLVASERAWIQHRIDACNAVREPAVPADLARMWCLSRETDKRTAYLLTIQ